MNYANSLDKTSIVINVLCTHLGMDVEDINKILKKKENKYLLLLLLKNYKCLDKEKIKKMLEIISDKSINYNINKAQEKLLINKEFRKMYFKIEEGLDKII